VEELDHKACKALECTWYANCWTDFDQDAFSGVDEYLEFASFIDGRVEECEEALMRDVRSSVTDVSVHFSHHSDVLVAVQ